MTHFNNLDIHIYHKKVSVHETFHLNQMWVFFLLSDYMADFQVERLLRVELVLCSQLADSVQSSKLHLFEHHILKFIAA